MKKLLAVAAVTIMASGAAFAGTLAYGFINDTGGAVDAALVPTGGDATFVRVQNFGTASVDMTAIMIDTTGATVGTNTGTLVPGAFFSYRPGPTFQGVTPNGGGASTGAFNYTVFHDGASGTVGGNVVVSAANGSRLGFLIQEQI